MSRHYFLVIVAAALGCLFLIFFTLWEEVDTSTIKEPIIPPPLAPFKNYISGVGIVEPKSDSILIGSPINRIVDRIVVNVGSKVKKGAPLFYLENRDLKANLLVQEAAYKSALAKLHRLEALPRQEDLSVATEALNSAKAGLELAKEQNEMVLALPDPRALSLEERNRRQYNYQQAEAKLQQAQANLNKITEGSWKPDLEIAHYELLQAKANVNLIRTEIERTIVHSPIDGTVLQIKVHEGEFPPLDGTRTPVMVLGDLDQKYLRVNINQLNIPKFNPSASAVAYLQGDATMQFPLEYISMEPLLVKKQNFTNEITETVDTRVMQLIYKINTMDRRVFIGQQMDVFIEIKQDHESN